MKKITFMLLVVFAAINLYAQENKKPLTEELTGTWTLVSVDNIYPDGSKVHPYGDNPQGLLIFDAQGNYAIQIYKALRTQVASGDKNKSTPEENAAMVQGSNAHFGRYLVDEKSKTIVFNIAHASFPNWEGTVQKRSYTYTGSQIKYVVTHTTQGGQAVIAEVAWRRL
jgi:hypothetical protein